MHCGIEVGCRTPCTNQVIQQVGFVDYYRNLASHWECVSIVACPGRSHSKQKETSIYTGCSACEVSPVGGRSVPRLFKVIGDRS